jgi:hypothetical protein
MIKAFLLFLMIEVFFLLNTPSLAAETVVFNPSKGATGYIVYYDDGSTVWSKDLGNVTQFDMGILKLDVGVEYMMNLTAYNIKGESTPSETFKFMIKPFAPKTNPKIESNAIDLSPPVGVEIKL